MKHKKIILTLAIAIFFGVNAMTSLSNLSKSKTSFEFIFSKANADIGIGGYENWKSCEIESSGVYSCMDDCDGTSGTKCDEAIACAAGLEGMC